MGLVITDKTDRMRGLPWFKLLEMRICRVGFVKVVHAAAVCDPALDASDCAGELIR
jgi:hypothetical protein